MRPLRLTLRGFRSHVDETTFDFEGRSFLAIVGPTGAGKSTILDGISYALYAKTPRERRNSSALVSTRAKKASLTYRFAVGPDTFEINRSIPAASDDHLVHVDTGDKAIGSTAITTKVEELLGLDFDGFASSVLLAQGRFDLFLKATTKERTGILKGIFRIERVDDLRRAAVTRRDAVDHELNKIEGERRHIPEDAAEKVRESKVEVKTLEARIGMLEKTLPEETALLEREKEAQKEKDTAGAEIVALTEAVRRLPPSETLEQLAEREAECASTTKEATTTFESCTKAAEKATKELDALQKKLGDLKALHAARVKAEDLSNSESEIAELAAEVQGLEKFIAAAETEVSKATAAEKKAREALAAARSVVDELNRIHAAHQLRSSLAKGDPCPVCERTVTTLPKTKQAGDVATAQAAVASAEVDLDRARGALGEAKDRLATERQRSKSSTAAHAKAVAALEETRAAIEGVVGKVKDPVASIEERLTRFDEAVAAREEALESRERAQNALNQCATLKQDLDKERQGHVGALIELAVKLGATAPSVDESAAGLISKVGAMADRASERGEELRSRIEKAALMVKEAAGSLAGLRARAGGVASLADALNEAKRDEAVMRHVVEELTKKLERAKELNELESSLRARRALFHQLADDLTDRHFVNFLLEDRRRLLSELASERLNEMTRRYRFTDDGEFNIVDELEGDVERGTETLSGGETFLASLALALGLAETATRHGGRLQSFFLDEGFDSLDAEMLDQALDGIERIVTPDRLIALVSHVPALEARVEDVIVLAKDPDGSTVVRSGGSL